MSKKQTSLERSFAKGKRPEETCAPSTDSTATRNQLQTDQNHVKADLTSPVQRWRYTVAECRCVHSIPIWLGYIHAIEFNAYLFIHCHLQCSYSAFIYLR